MLKIILYQCNEHSLLWLFSIFLGKTVHLWKLETIDLYQIYWEAVGNMKIFMWTQIHDTQNYSEIQDGN